MELRTVTDDIYYQYQHLGYTDPAHLIGVVADLQAKYPQATFLTYPDGEIRVAGLNPHDHLMADFFLEGCNDAINGNF